MFNNKLYNVDFNPRKRRSKYDPEGEAMHEFLATNHDNMCFEYSNEREANCARMATQKYAREARQPLSISLRGNTIVITRKGNKV